MAFLRWLYIVDGNRGIVTGKTGNGNQFVRGGEKENAARTGTSIIENGTKKGKWQSPFKFCLSLTASIIAGKVCSSIKIK